MIPEGGFVIEFLDVSPAEANRNAAELQPNAPPYAPPLG
jgi:hypothetical protein